MSDQFIILQKIFKLKNLLKKTMTFNQDVFSFKYFSSAT